MGIETTTTTAGGGDYTWLASQRGTEYPKSGTLDVSAFTIADGYIPSGTPVAYDGASGLYEPAAGTSTAAQIDGFVLHDVSATTAGADQPFALITDATIIAANVPGTHDLVNGRYQCDTVNVTGS